MSNSSAADEFEEAPEELEEFEEEPEDSEEPEETSEEFEDEPEDSEELEAEAPDSTSDILYRYSTKMNSNIHVPVYTIGSTNGDK